MPRLILASASPRRQTLLREAGYAFDVIPADLDEEALGRGLRPLEMVAALALAKGRHVAGRFSDAIVLAADTVVALGERALGKPADAGAARQMISDLANTTHEVITGVAVLHVSDGVELLESVVSTIQTRPLSAQEIDRYIASNLWQGKAGGYGIQDPDPFIIRTTGCRTNIVGLPMTTTARMLASVGIRST